MFFTCNYHLKHNIEDSEVLVLRDSETEVRIKGSMFFNQIIL